MGLHLGDTLKLYPKGSDGIQGQGLSCPVKLAYLPLSLEERKRVTVVPQTGQGPLAIGRPLEVVPTVPSVTVRFSRHLTQ
jgi:hypothetical protein